MKSWSRNVRWLVSHVPIYGQLLNSSRKAMISAAKELFVATIFSLFPIWFYPLILWIIADRPLWDTLRSFAAGGELYLYSAALLGPWLYAMHKRYGGSEAEDNLDESTSETHGFPRSWSIQFPYGTSFSVVAVLIACTTAFLFGLLRTSTPPALAFEADEGTTLWVSGTIYFISLSCMFCILVYRLNLESVRERFGQDTEELRKEWQRRK